MELATEWAGDDFANYTFDVSVLTFVTCPRRCPKVVSYRIVDLEMKPVQIRAGE